MSNQSNVAPIARVIISEDAPAQVVLYAPGLPPGEHDLFPVPLDPNGALAPFMEPLTSKQLLARLRNGAAACLKVMVSQTGDIQEMFHQLALVLRESAEEIELLLLKAQQLTLERDAMLEDIAALRMAEQLNVDTVANFQKRIDELEREVDLRKKGFRPLREAAAEWREREGVSPDAALRKAAESHTCECTACYEMRAIINSSPAKAAPPAAVPSKFDLAFEVMRLMDREEMDTLQSCHFGYVLRVERERHAPTKEGCPVVADGKHNVVNGECTHCRNAVETFAGVPGFPPETPEQERSMRRDRYPPRDPGDNSDPFANAPLTGPGSRLEADLVQIRAAGETKATPAYCKCSFTDSDGAVAQGEPCPIHPEK